MLLHHLLATGHQVSSKLGSVSDTIWCCGMLQLLDTTLHCHYYGKITQLILSDLPMQRQEKPQKLGYSDRSLQLRSYYLSSFSDMDSTCFTCTILLTAA